MYTKHYGTADSEPHHIFIYYMYARGILRAQPKRRLSVYVVYQPTYIIY